jgi:drug/metabolite transporter (DMT)-like permease
VTLEEIGMDSDVFAAVLAAAFLHASWNALVKLEGDRFLSVVVLSVAQGVIAIALLPAFPLPAEGAWPWIALSALLHTGYKLFLVRAYQHGDLSQVYPLARGTAPLVVALVGAIALSEPMTPTKGAAVVAIGFGVVLMSLRGGTGALRALPGRAVAYGLGTALFTASYTIVDGIGARLAGSASAYTLWMFAGDGLLMTALGLARRGRGALPTRRGAWIGGVLAGALSLASYWIAIWAFTKAPIALVAALRETSVLFALAIAFVVLREKPGRWRLAASGLILAGVVLIRL